MLVSTVRATGVLLTGLIRVVSFSVEALRQHPPRSVISVGSEVGGVSRLCFLGRSWTVAVLLRLSLLVRCSTNGGQRGAYFCLVVVRFVH